MVLPSHTAYACVRRWRAGRCSFNGPHPLRGEEGGVEEGGSPFFAQTDTHVLMGEPPPPLSIVQSDVMVSETNAGGVRVGDGRNGRMKALVQPSAY